MSHLTKHCCGEDTFVTFCLNQSRKGAELRRELGIYVVVGGTGRGGSKVTPNQQQGMGPPKELLPVMHSDKNE
jgi:hypothetical protein